MTTVEPVTASALGRAGQGAGRRLPWWVGPAAWAGLVLVAFATGGAVRADRSAHVGAAPFVGSWVPQAGWRLVPAVVLAGLAVALGPTLAATLRWRALLLASGAGGLAWAVALAWTRSRPISDPLATRYEYLRVVPGISSVGDFVRGFVDAVPGYPTHVKSHPPGTVVVFWVLDRVGLPGPGPATVVVLVAGTLAGVAALMTLREVAGEAAARRAAPFVALAPAAVFVATSTDALFAGVAAGGVALVVLASGRRGRRSSVLAVLGGLVLGASLFLSYGLVLLLVLPAAVCVRRHRLDVLVVAGAVMAGIAVAFAAAGFWWLDGLDAARAAYGAGQSALRPYRYFVVANLAVFAVLIGPATAGALTRLRDRRAWLLVGGALAAVGLADASGLSKGEVERIWLPFVPWVVLACCALPGRARPWLAANLGTGLALQLLLRSPW